MTTIKTTTTARKTLSAAVAPVVTHREVDEPTIEEQSVAVQVANAWSAYLESLDAVAAANAQVQDALRGLKELGNQFEIDGEVKQVRSRSNKDTGETEYYLVNLKTPPAEWAKKAKERKLSKIREELAEQLHAAAGNLDVDDDLLNKLVSATVDLVEGKKAAAKKTVKVSDRPEGDIVIG